MSSKQDAPDQSGSTVTDGKRRSRWWWLLPAGGILALGLVVFAVGATVWEYTNSSAFCGTTCHTMPPEYTAYLVSPHARVSCVDCHLGQESVLVTIPEKAKEIRHVVGALTQKYETPIYVKSMRPARDTCEECHSPEKFSNDVVREVRHYAGDPSNSLTSTWLVMKTGGGTQREGLGKGIHWHIENEVWYVATDELKQEIPYVRTIDADGNVTEYTDVSAGLPADFGARNQDNLRRMDCIDCHNRISHNFRPPEAVLDQALARRQIDPEMPEIKDRGTALLSASYPNHQAAVEAIEGLEFWYQENYPDYFAANHRAIQQAIDVLKQGYESSVFPDMDVGWQTHPDNQGHTLFPGCFRCHGGKHVSSDQTTIRLECNICHSIPLVKQPGDNEPAAMTLQRPDEPDSHRDSNWLARHRFQFDASCAACHDISNPGGSDDSSFCSNSACHAREWQYVGLDAPGVRAITAPPVGQGSGELRAVPHPVGERTDCRICHDRGKVRPFPESHAAFSLDMCMACHQPPPGYEDEVQAAPSAAP